MKRVQMLLRSYQREREDRTRSEPRRTLWDEWREEPLRLVLTIIGAFVVLVLVQLIPFLGSLATFLLTVMGIGALKYQFMKQYNP